MENEKNDVLNILFLFYDTSVFHCAKNVNNSGLQRVRRLARSNTVDTSTANKIINRLNNSKSPSVNNSQPGSPLKLKTNNSIQVKEESSIHSDPTSAVSTPTIQAAPSSTLVRKMSSRTSSRKIVLNDQIMAAAAQAVAPPSDNFDMEQMQKSLLVASEQTTKKSSRKSSHRDSSAAQQWEIPPPFHLENLSVMSFAPLQFFFCYHYEKRIKRRQRNFRNGFFSVILMQKMHWILKGKFPTVDTATKLWPLPMKTGSQLQHQQRQRSAKTEVKVQKLVARAPNTKVYGAKWVSMECYKPQLLPPRPMPLIPLKRPRHHRLVHVAKKGHLHRDGIKF